MKVVEAALVPMREHDLHILNYLDDWFILAQSREQLCEHRDICAQTPEPVGFSGQLGKEKTLPHVEEIFSCCVVGLGQC